MLCHFLSQLLQFCFLLSWLLSSIKYFALWLRCLSATCESLIRTPAHLSSLLNGRKRASLKLYFNFSSSQFRRLTIIIRLFLTSNSGATSLVCVLLCVVFFFFLWGEFSDTGACSLWIQVYKYEPPPHWWWSFTPSVQLFHQNDMFK